MALSNRTLLRVHIETVWGVGLPTIEQNDIQLLPGSPQPSWKLCAANIAEGREYIWRPDVSAAERNMLRLRVDEALEFSLNAPMLPGVNREIAFSQVATPRLAITEARTIARPLMPEDRHLVETFTTDTSDINYYFQPAKHPLIGVVVANRLVCVAHSSRRTEEACELGIDTLSDARRKGYALAATLVWAQAVRQEGLLPFYSALAENKASLALAHAAGYRPFARVATFEG
jgi:hypothetical protein